MDAYLIEKYMEIYLAGNVKADAQPGVDLTELVFCSEI